MLRYSYIIQTQTTELNKMTIRAEHSEFFKSIEDAQETIDFYKTEGEPFKNPEINGPDEDGLYTISYEYSWK